MSFELRKCRHFFTFALPITTERLSAPRQLFVDAKDDKGVVQAWEVWFSSANGLYRRGWRDDDLPVGAAVTVTGFQARDGSRQLYGGGQTRLSDGRVLFGGDNPEEGR